MDRDLYKDLGVESTATDAELKAAWRAASKRHPDIGGDPEVYIHAKLAYDFLSDPERRAKYDALRGAGPGKRRRARADFEATWDAFEATLGELLPYLQSLRSSAKGSDWWSLAEAGCGLVNALRGKKPPPPKQEPKPEGITGLSAKLRELQAAHLAGLLTDDEYKMKRASLLDSF